MAEDLYTEWLRIPPGPRPPDHYTLLGLPPFCDDVARIDAAVARQLDRLDRRALHPDPAMRQACQRLMNQVALARTVLVSPQRRAAYDASLGAGANADAAASVEFEEQPESSAELADIALVLRQRGTRRQAARPTWRRSAAIAAIAVLIAGGVILWRMMSHQSPENLEVAATSPQFTAPPAPVLPTPRVSISPAAVSQASPAIDPGAIAPSIAAVVAPIAEPAIHTSSFASEMPPALPRMSAPAPRPKPAPMPQSVVAAANGDDGFTVTASRRAPLAAAQRDAWQFTPINEVDEMSFGFSLKYPYIAWQTHTFIEMEDLASGRVLIFRPAGKGPLRTPQIDGHMLLFASDSHLYCYDLSNDHFRALANKKCQDFCVSQGTVLYFEGQDVVLDNIGGTSPRVLEKSGRDKLFPVITADQASWMEGKTSDPPKLHVACYDRHTGRLSGLPNDDAWMTGLVVDRSTIAWEQESAFQLAFRKIYDGHMTVLPHSHAPELLSVAVSGDTFIYTSKSGSGEKPYVMYRYDARSGNCRQVLDSSVPIYGPVISGALIVWRNRVAFGPGVPAWINRCYVLVNRDGKIQQLDHPTHEGGLTQISGDCLAWFGRDVDDRGNLGATHIWIAQPPSQGPQAMLSP